MKMMSVLVAALAVTAFPISSARSAEAPPGSVSCSGCHAARADVQSAIPRLNGRNASELVQQMAAFRSGQRPATIMDQIAKGYSEAEIQAIADWYAAQQ
jgi:cytochrome subunit of sulfide dehydrogenase